MAKPIGYYSKEIDGEKLVMPAYVQADAVTYVYNGWADVTGEVTAAQQAAKEAKAQAADEAPASGGKTAAKKSASN